MNGEDGTPMSDVREVIADSLERQEPNSYDWTLWVDPLLAALYAAGYVVVREEDAIEMLSAMDYVSEYLQKKWGYGEIRERVNAALTTQRDQDEGGDNGSR